VFVSEVVDAVALVASVDFDSLGIDVAVSVSEANVREIVGCVAVVEDQFGFDSVGESVIVPVCAVSVADELVVVTEVEGAEVLEDEVLVNVDVEATEYVLLVSVFASNVPEVEVWKIVVKVWLVEDGGVLDDGVAENVGVVNVEGELVFVPVCVDSVAEERVTVTAVEGAVVLKDEVLVNVDVEASE
jgi:hypothetical protein